MVSSPKPTPHQLRQHALDRALQPDVVQALARNVDGGGREPDEQELADRILVVATEFTAWLAGPVEHEENYGEDTIHKVHQALMRAGLTEDNAINAINEMQNDGILFRERASD